MSDEPELGAKVRPKLRLGTRNSPLAMAQAVETQRRLCAAHGWDESAVELVPVVASGDKVLDRPLAEIGGKALWTKELDAWLAEGRIDVSVHSAKDVETIRPDVFSFAACLPRADRRDSLVGAESIASIASGSIIGTSAPRRAAQLLNLRPDCKVVTFRGNVATRLGKLEAGEADVTFLAAAGLER
ncbi:MAG: hydroxymethylbilane synthase, partial [Pseudomonadota bacterium]